MKCDYQCEHCKHEFEAELYKIGNCPKCNCGFWWDENCTEDYSDCWEYVWWDIDHVRAPYGISEP